MTMSIIKEKRQSLGLTQKEFAIALGLGINGERTLRRWENGETHPSPIETKALLEFASTPPFMKSDDAPYLFKFIDLFAGIGGIRLPFQEVGGKCVFTSEWDKFAQKTYKFNFGDEPSGDITQIGVDSIPDFDILLAGFPCQPFSQAGLRKGFADTRGTLFFNIENIISIKRPAAFMLENVKQLKGHDKGRTLKIIIQNLKDLGYTVNFDVLRAADFGVPQNRERIFLVGFDSSRFNLSEDYSFPFPKPLKIPTKVGDILEKNVDSKYTISNKLYEGHIRRKLEHKKKGNGFGFSVVSENTVYTNTLSARYYKDGSEILVLQDNESNPRKLTPRECARLQGFPENFIIPVSDTQAYRQFGNSVSIPVVRRIASQMISELKKLNFIDTSKNISQEE